MNILVWNDSFFMYFLNSEDTKQLTYVGVLFGEGVWMVFVGFLSEI